MRKYSQKILACFIIACFLFSIITPGAIFAQDTKPTPTDINGHWAVKQISQWINKDLVKGYEDGTFKPDKNITRAEFITLVNRAFEFTDAKDVKFSDVNTKDWFYGEIAKAIAAGYIGGYPDNTIKPNNTISRQEVASISVQSIKFRRSQKLKCN